MSQFGRVDILVNGAAGNFLAEAKSLTPRGFKTVMDIDTQGTFNMCHSIYPAMTKSGDGGAIINISMTLHYGGENYFDVDTETTCLQLRGIRHMRPRQRAQLIH